MSARRNQPIYSRPTRPQPTEQSHPTQPPPEQQEFYVGSLWLAAWLIVQNHLRFLRCERGTGFGTDATGFRPLQAIFVFADPFSRGRALVHQFVHGNPSGNVKKLRETLSELRAELLRVNNSKESLRRANQLSALMQPELHGTEGDDDEA